MTSTMFATMKTTYDTIAIAGLATPEQARDIRVKAVIIAMKDMLSVDVFDNGTSVILNDDADLGNMFRAYYDEISEKWSTTDGGSFEEAGPHGIDATFEDVTEWIAQQWRDVNADI